MLDYANISKCLNLSLNSLVVLMCGCQDIEKGYIDPFQNPLAGPTTTTTTNNNDTNNNNTNDTNNVIMIILMMMINNKMILVILRQQ